MIELMTETPTPAEPATGPVDTTPPHVPPPAAAAPQPAVVAPQPYKQSRLNQVAAWVGIVAGSVFIVAVIFGTGFVLGAHSGDRGFDRHESVMFKHRAEPAFPMGPMGPMERAPFVFRGPNFPPPGAPGAPGGSEGPGTPGAPGPARP